VLVVWQRRVHKPETTSSTFKHCRRWKGQQVIMWRTIRKATNGKRKARSTSMAPALWGRALHGRYFRVSADDGSRHAGMVQERAQKILGEF
jgi:hypothetical protein